MPTHWNSHSSTHHTFHHAKKKCHPIDSLDRHLGGGWSTRVLSSKSPVVVNFAVAPGKDKAELKRQLTNEKMHTIN